MTAFQDLFFGYSSAEEEGSWNERLLTEGFYDLDNAVSRALDGPRFLFLGPKGAGKSAIAIRLRLLASSDPMLFVSYRPLTAIPFRSYFDALGTDVPEMHSAIWAIILRLALLSSIADDAGTKHTDGDKFREGLSVLRSAQLLPNDTTVGGGWSASTRSIKAGFSATVQLAVEQTWAHSAKSMPTELAPYLTRLLTGVSTRSRHLVIVDDVDELLMDERLSSSTDAESLRASLAGLIMGAKRLNNEAAAAGLPAKILVMCRSDIYDMWTGPNQNKTRQDSAVYIDWASYRDPDEPSRHLVALCNLRARLVDPHIDDVFRDFLPIYIADGQDTLQYLLMHTRYTPRDLLRLMTYIRDESTAMPRVTQDAVINGVSQYTRRYFLQEIRDEMAGHVTSASTHKVISTLRSLGESVFDFRTLYSQYGLNGYFSDVDDDPRATIVPVLETMFECGAIGNVDALQERSSTNTGRYRFFGDESPLNIHDNIIVHPALCRALNIPYSCE